MSQKQAYFKRAVLGSAIAACMASLSVYAADMSDEDTDKLFKEGMYQRELGNLFTSIEAFQTVLSNQPALNRARLELAVSYYRTLNSRPPKNRYKPYWMIRKPPRMCGWLHWHFSVR